MYSLTSLQNLQLYGGHDDPDGNRTPKPREMTLQGGPAAFLQLFPKLKRLQSLMLVDIECDWPPASPAYSALTASSQLTQFGICISPFPRGVWEHVFAAAAPPGRLPQLQHVELGGSSPNGFFNYNYDEWSSVAQKPFTTSSAAVPSCTASSYTYNQACRSPG